VGISRKHFQACVWLVAGTALWGISFPLIKAIFLKQDQLLPGVPSAILWGILAAVLRFVPYIGAAIAAAFPLALALAVDPTWTMLLWTVALFVVVEPVVGHVIEPMVYGHSTGLSPVAVVASATFWTALWGPIGLVLATPLTVCLVVLGRHVERLEFLDVMFGDRPALSPPEIFYQRMLAGDPTEASEKAEEFLKERSLSSYYDEVALKGLQLAHIDAERGALDPERLAKIRDAVSEFANNISDQEDRPLPKAKLTTDAEASSAVETVAEDAPYENLPVLTKEDLPSEWQGEHPVLCVAGRSLLDEAAAITVQGIGELCRIRPRPRLDSLHRRMLERELAPVDEIPAQRSVRMAILVGETEPDSLARLEPDLSGPLDLQEEELDRVFYPREHRNAGDCSFVCAAALLEFRA